MITNALNPEALTDKERQFGEVMESLWFELFDELKSNGYLKKKFKKEKIYPLLKMYEMQDHMSEAYNAITQLFEPGKRPGDDFFQINEKYGLTKQHFPYVYFTLLITRYIMESESMRTTILSVLQPKSPINEKSTLNHLFESLASKKVASKTMQKLLPLKTPWGNPLFDWKIRNALGHSQYWYEKNNLVACPQIGHCLQINLTKFMLMTKSQNIATKTLIGVFSHNVKTGYFNKN